MRIDGRPIMRLVDGKKMLNMQILEILWIYTDEDHSLTQQQIIKYLRENYDVECDRRSVKSNILMLKEAGFEISMDHGYSLISRPFEEDDLRLMIDSILFSKSIPTKKARSLIERIKALGSRNFDPKVKYVMNLPELNRTENKAVPYTMDAIERAIDNKQKIRFIYNEVSTEKKNGRFVLKPKRNEPYIVNPYRIVANNGRFYLIGNMDSHDNLIHFRIDKMTETSILEEKARAMDEIEEIKDGFSLPKHMAEHVYMFSGETIPVTIKTETWMMSQLVDWFGDDISILKKENQMITVRFMCNEKAAHFWALQYSPEIEVLEPEELRDTLLSDARKMLDIYGNGVKQDDHRKD